MEPKRPNQGGSIPEKNGGEGNYDASRRYREGLEKSLQKGDSEQLGEKAKKALEGPEGEELRRADEKGKNAGK